MASLRDEVIGRIEKLEIMMATILELLQGSSSSTMNPKMIPKNNDPRAGEPTATKPKERTKAEPPGEESVPMPPFGWKTITRKPRKIDKVEKNLEKPEEKRVPLRLVEKDWSIKILSREELVRGTEGVCLTTDDHAAEVLPLLINQNLKLVLITPSRLNNTSTKFDCRCLAVNDRLTKITRWYTNLGSQIVVPSFLEMGSDTARMKLTNTTVKIVLQVVKKYSTADDWRIATSNPGAALRDWVAEAGASPDLVHSYRPIHKDKLQGGAQWVEQVVILKASGAKLLMKASGTKGIFAKRFLGEDQPPASTDWKIVWVGQEMKLKTLLDRGQILGEDYKGLAHGRNGLGVRVPHDSYSACGKHLLGDAFVPAKDNSNIFEVSKIPVWVSPDELITELISKMAWVTEFVRVNKAYGGYKSFIVRGSMDPPKDCFLIDDDLVLIQPAKPMRGEKVSISYFEGKVPSNGKGDKNLAKGTTTTPTETQHTEVGGPVPKRRKSSITYDVAQ